uniref:(northern house mosquito) hypothetical protein n=1 Tax=Culex pipiens TaxID=7175 RepID=A0A8D8EVM1_CULPI
MPKQRRRKGTLRMPSTVTIWPVIWTVSCGYTWSICPIRTVLRRFCWRHDPLKDPKCCPDTLSSMVTSSQQYNIWCCAGLSVMLSQLLKSRTKSGITVKCWSRAPVQSLVIIWCWQLTLKAKSTRFLLENTTS